MAFSAVASRGTGTSSTSNSTLTCTPTATIAVGRIALFTIAADNTSTTDGDNSEVSSVTDTSGNVWFKCGEYTNGQGSAGTGVTVSVWASEITTALTTGSTVTATFGSNRTDKCCGLYEFSVAAATGVRLAQAANGTPTDGSNGFGSTALSPSLGSAARLYFAGYGKEANSTTGLTVSSNFVDTGFTVRSRNNAAAVLMRAEYRINTSTGETANPTLAVSGDSAAVLFALEEVPGLVQSGQLAISGAIGVSGDVVALSPAGGFRSQVLLFPYGLGTPVLFLSLDPDSVNLAGALAVSGDITVTGAAAAGGFRSQVLLWPHGFGVQAAGPFVLEQAGSVTISAVSAITGDIEASLAIQQSGSIGLAGSLSISGDVTSSSQTMGFRSPVLLWPHGFGTLIQFSLTQVGAINASASISADGNLLIEEPWELSQPAYLPEFVSAISVAGDLLIDEPWEFVEAIDLPEFAGAMTVAGDVQIQMPSLELAQAGSIDLLGVATLTGDLGYAVDIQQSGSIALAGGLTTSGDLLVAWDLVTSALSLAGGVAVGGDVSIAGPILVDITVVDAIALAGALQAAGDIGAAVDVSQVGSLNLSGSMAVAGDLSATTLLELAPTQPIAIAGAAAVAGDISIGAPVQFDLVASGPAALAGELLAAGDLGVAFDLQVEAAVGITASFSAAGDVLIGIPFDLEQQAGIAIQAGLSAAGDVLIGVPFEFGVLGAIEMSGELAVGGFVEYELPFELEILAPLSDVVGGLSISGGDITSRIPPEVIYASLTTEMRNARQSNARTRPKLTSTRRRG